MTSNKKHSTVPTRSVSTDINCFETDKDMHKRAEDLAGKISATVTITTNSTSKLSGGNPREKNDFLATQNNTPSGSTTKATKHGLQEAKVNSTNSQQHMKQLQVGGKPALDPKKLIPNLSSLKPIPPCNNTSKSLLPNYPSL
jgi:hypothetical protein